MNLTSLAKASQLELLYLKDGVKFTEEVTDESLKNTVDRVVGIKEQIDERCVSGSFEPTKSKLCDYCSYKSICPAWSRK
jgi:putative RecB family exonuclease